MGLKVQDDEEPPTLVPHIKYSKKRLTHKKGFITYPGGFVLGFPHKLSATKHQTDREGILGIVSAPSLPKAAPPTPSSWHRLPGTTPNLLLHKTAPKC